MLNVSVYSISFSGKIFEKHDLGMMNFILFPENPRVSSLPGPELTIHVCMALVPA
jgi:hypothetical protein